MEKSENEQKAFKILFVGESGTGAKTSLIKCIIGEDFDRNERTTNGCTYYVKRVKTSKGEILLYLLDTIGQEKYRKYNKCFLKMQIALLLALILLMRWLLKKLTIIIIILKRI